VCTFVVICVLWTFWGSQSADELAWLATAAQNVSVRDVALILAGLPLSVGGATVNRLCGSGLQAVNSAAGALGVGAGEVAIAGGVESMTRAPFVMPKADTAFPREQRVYDTSIGWRMLNPRMPDEHTLAMGETAENIYEMEKIITREQQDEFALASQVKHATARQAGLWDEEIVPLAVTGGKGPAITVSEDEHPRPDTTAEKLASLPAAFMRTNSGPMDQRPLEERPDVLVYTSAPLGEPLEVNGVGNRQERTDRVAELLRLVGLRPEYMRRYPHAFRGGQRQRIGIAHAPARTERRLPRRRSRRVN